MSEQEICIRLEKVSKSFNKANSGNDIVGLVKRIFNKNRRSTKLQVLKNISFTVKRGEFLGIIGRNGSGKSTLINILMGTLKPDSGTVEVKGRTIRMALAMGFDHELNARENIYLNGTVLGLSFKQIGSIYNDIIDFAELRDFEFTPLKFYSNGMRTRLAFSVAIYAQADIFLMDEFFGGVGDEIFKYKSEKVFHESLIDGRTIVHVSHNVDMLIKYADNVLFLDKGEIKAYGPPEEVVPFYKEYFRKEAMAKKI